MRTRPVEKQECSMMYPGQNKKIKLVIYSTKTTMLETYKMLNVRKI